MSWHILQSQSTASVLIILLAISDALLLLLLLGRCGAALTAGVGSGPSRDNLTRPFRLLDWTNFIRCSCSPNSARPCKAK